MYGIFSAAILIFILLSPVANADSQFYSNGQQCEIGHNKSCLSLLEGCLAGKAAACFYLGNSLAIRDFIKDAIFFTRMACLAGVPEGCLNLPYLRERLRILNSEISITS